MKCTKRIQLLSWCVPAVLALTLAGCGNSSKGVSSSAPSSSSHPVSSSSNSISSSSSSKDFVGGKGMSGTVNFPLGIAVPDGTGKSGVNILSNSARQQVVVSDFSQITIENKMKMSYLDIGFSDADGLVKWASDNGLTVHGHALVWHPDYQLPSWAKNPGSDFKQKLQDHVKKVTQHYAQTYPGTVVSWDVVNEALYDKSDNAGGDGDGYRKSVFFNQYGGPGYIADAFRAAREGDPNAILYYNDFNTEENQAKTDKLVELIGNLLDQGVPIDGVGFQMHVLPDWAPIDSIRQALQKIVDLDPDLFIKITELDVRVNNPYDGDSSNDYTDRDDCAVSCEGLLVQKARYKQIVETYLEVVPAHRRGGITVWGIADQDSWFYDGNGSANLPDWPLLFNNSLEPKPAYDGFKEALLGAK